LLRSKFGQVWATPNPSNDAPFTHDGERSNNTAVGKKLRNRPTGRGAARSSRMYLVGGRGTKGAPIKGGLEKHFGGGESRGLRAIGARKLQLFKENRSNSRPRDHRLWVTMEWGKTFQKDSRGRNSRERKVHLNMG